MKNMWMPIETAPKDGTHILAYRKFEDGRELITNMEYIWVENMHGKMKRYNPATQRLDLDGNWFVIVTTGYDADGDEEQPTHWMPMPPPPTKE